MKIKLEFDDCRFATTRENIGGETRWLMVTIEGKPFAVCRTMDGSRWPDKQRDEYFDRLLIENMERILRKVFVDACKAIPEGTNLLDEEVR
jgi:hypothetical protein